HPHHAVDPRRGNCQRPRPGILFSAGACRSIAVGRIAMKLALITRLYVFPRPGFIGFEVIRRVSPLLHTPLMSLTNGLDAIAVVGAILLVGEHKSTLSEIGR